MELKQEQYPAANGDVIAAKLRRNPQSGSQKPPPCG
jgi:hypothetical protein